MSVGRVLTVGSITKYDSAEELMTSFYHLRLSYYEKRKVRTTRIGKDIADHKGIHGG